MHLLYSYARLIRSVMLEAMEMRGKVKWLRDLEQSLEELGWKGVSVEDMRRLSSGEIRQMLRDSAWRMVTEAWDAEIQERSKLGVVKGLLECGCQSRCVDVGSKRIRRMLAKLRGGTAELRVETGRWNGLKKEERICKQCTMGEVENEEHFLLRCEGYAEERKTIVGYMGELVEGWQEMDAKKKLALVMDCACTDGRMGRAIQKMWSSRFG